MADLSFSTIIYCCQQHLLIYSSVHEREASCLRTSRDSLYEPLQHPALSHLFAACLPAHIPSRDRGCRASTGPISPLPSLASALTETLSSYLPISPLFSGSQGPRDFSPWFARNKRCHLRRRLACLRRSNTTVVYLLVPAMSPRVPLPTDSIFALS